MHVQLVLDSLLQLGLIPAARVGALAAGAAVAAAVLVLVLGVVDIICLDALLLH